MAITNRAKRAQVKNKQRDEIRDLCHKALIRIRSVNNQRLQVNNQAFSAMQRGKSVGEILDQLSLVVNFDLEALKKVDDIFGETIRQMRDEVIGESHRY